MAFYKHKMTVFLLLKKISGGQFKLAKGGGLLVLFPLEKNLTF